MSPRDEAAKIDPDYFKADRKQTRRFWGSIILAIVSIAAATYAVVGTRELQTACNKDPSSQECAEVRLEVAKAEPLRNPCASYQRVTSRRGRNCERYYVKPDRKGAAQPSAAVGGDSGDGPAVAQGGTQATPAPGQTADSGPDTHSKSPGNPKQPQQGPPTQGGGDSPMQSTSSTGSSGATTSPPPASGEAPTSRGVAPEVLETAGEKVGDLVDNVEGAVNQVGCTVRGVLRPCP